MEKMFVQVPDEIQFKDGGIYSKTFFKTEKYNYSLMCLSKGTDIDTHTSTKDGCVYVLRGRGKFVLCGRDIDLEPGVLINMPADAPHALRADEDLAFLLCLHA